MIKGHPVTVIIPAGRERYLRLLLPHLLARRDLIDACHLWVNTTNPLDIACLRALEARMPGFFKCIPCRGPVEGNRSVARFYGSEYRVQGALFIKLDDDIVWIDPEALRVLLEFRLSHPEYFLVYANVWNNQLIDHLNQRAGLLGDCPFIEWNAGGSSWSSGESAERIHRQLLKALCSGLTDRHYRAFERWQLLPEERCSINFICWRGEDMAAVSPHGLYAPFPGSDDEAYLSCRAPRLVGKRNVICGGALAAHFAFYTQREHMDRTDILDAWASHCPAPPAPHRSYAAQEAAPHRESEGHPIPSLAVTSPIFSSGGHPRCDWLFLHHQADSITSRNLDSIRRHAPRWCRVVPVHVRDAYKSCVPGSIEVSLDDFPRNSTPRISGIWSETDLVMAAWCEQQGTRAGFIVQVEYDVHAHAPLAPLLELCAKLDCTGNCRHSPVSGYWADVHTEVKGKKWLSGKSQIIPLAFRSASLPAIKLMAEEIRRNPEWHNVYCELRWPSVADRLGLESHYVNAPPEAFWWRGPAMYKPGAWFPLTHPAKNSPPGVDLLLASRK